MKWAALLFVLLAGTAFADVKVTTGPVISPDGEHHTNLAKCVAHVTAMLAANPDGPISLRCDRSTEVRAICPPDVEPALPTELTEVATQCPNDDNRWYNRWQGWKRAEYPGCGWNLVLFPEEAQPAKFCTDPQVSIYDPSPDDAPDAPIDPEFDEHSPEGPGPGPDGALPVDKPRTPPVTTGEPAP